MTQQVEKKPFGVIGFLLSFGLIYQVTTQCADSIAPAPAKTKIAMTQPIQKSIIKPSEPIEPKTVKENVPELGIFGNYRQVRHYLYDHVTSGLDWELLECTEAQYLKRKDAWETICKVKVENRFGGHDLTYLHALIQHDKVIEAKNATNAVNAVLYKK
jgi:hypothetical protein